jgi:hypothetical protein
LNKFLLLMANYTQAQVVNGMLNCRLGPTSQTGCPGAQIEMSDQGIQAFVGQTLSASSALIFYVANYEAFPDSLLLAVNAGRCAI